MNTMLSEISLTELRMIGVIDVERKILYKRDVLFRSKIVFIITFIARSPLLSRATLARRRGNNCIT